MYDNRFDNFAKDLKKGQIQVCVIMQNENIIFDYYKNRKAEANLHPIHSCTKSIVSMLVGICLRDGLISDIDTPIIEYLSGYTRYLDDAKQCIAIRHLLTMTPGFDWPEFGEWNFGSPMEYSKDIVKFVLERNLTEEVGTKMNYNSGCSNLLSYIIQTVSGVKLSEYASANLFTPLGISDYIWHEKQGISLGANGLKMKVADMVKLGCLCLHSGKLNNTVIILANWMEESTKPRFLTYEGIGSYGYHWWTSTLKTNKNEEVNYYFAMGLFGQYIIVIPQHQMVVVFVSENYGDTIKPMSYFRNNIADILE